MCNVCAVFAVLKYCKENKIQPEFCSAIVVHLMFLKSELKSNRSYDKQSILTIGNNVIDVVIRKITPFV